MMKISKPFLVVAAVATLFGASLFGAAAWHAVPAQAQTPGTGSSSSPHPVRVAGQVTSVSGTGLVLKTPRGDVNVSTGSNTWIVVRTKGGCAQGSLQDLQTGKPAVVMGMAAAAANSVEARVVSQGRCPLAPNAAKPTKRLAAIALANHLAAGTVKAVNGSTLTITPEKGKLDVTVNTTANTVVLNNGFQAVNSVKVGDKVQVFGRPDKAAGAVGKPTAGTPRTITAWGVRVVSPGEQVVAGRVEAVNGNTINLRTPKNQAGIAVTLDASTGYKALTITGNQPSLSSSSQAAVTVGTTLIVEGTGPADSKTMAAKAVIVLPAAKAKAKATTP